MCLILRQGCPPHFQPPLEYLDPRAAIQLQGGTRLGGRGTRRLASQRVTHPSTPPQRRRGRRRLRSIQRGGGAERKKNPHDDGGSEEGPHPGHHTAADCPLRPVHDVDLAVHPLTLSALLAGPGHSRTDRCAAARVTPEMPWWEAMPLMGNGDILLIHSRARLLSGQQPVGPNPRGMDRAHAGTVVVHACGPGPV